jgi:hypothetical protein
MAMKRLSTIEYIHGNIFPSQGKDKVYVFKMLIDGFGSGVDIDKRMQPRGDLENAWLMFDHVKRVKEWTTMASPYVTCSRKTRWSNVLCGENSTNS